MCLIYHGHFQDVNTLFSEQKTKLILKYTRDIVYISTNQPEVTHMNASSVAAKLQNRGYEVKVICISTVIVWDARCNQFALKDGAIDTEYPETLGYYDTLEQAEAAMLEVENKEPAPAKVTRKAQAVKALQKEAKVFGFKELWVDMYCDRANFLIPFHCQWFKDFCNRRNIIADTDRSGWSVSVKDTETLLGQALQAGKSYRIPTDSRCKIEQVSYI